MLVGNGHQVFQQLEAQTTALAFRLDGDVQQMCFIKDDLHHAMPHLLLTFKHQPDMVFAQAVQKYAPRPRVAESGVFNFQDGIKVRLGHWAEGYSVTHRLVSSAPSAGAWLATHALCVVAHPLRVPDPAAPMRSPVRRFQAHG